MDSALRRIDEKQHRITELEDELHRLRLHGSSQPRDFTDKSISNHDMVSPKAEIIVMPKNDEENCLVCMSILVEMSGRTLSFVI